MLLPQGKKIYFASDFHLGIPDRETSKQRERLLCKWLDSIQDDAACIYLVGDLFDVWFEYKRVIPKGYTRFLGKLAQLRDQGITIEVFTGNHDLWMAGYFEEELDIPVHYKPLEIDINGKHFFIAHGDGLGPGDNSYKLLKHIMSNKVAQWLYRRLHPDTGVAIADYFSRRGMKHSNAEVEYLGPEKEWLVQFACEKLKEKHYDFFIFGHRHLALNIPLTAQTTFINLGDWISFNSYAVFDGTHTELMYYKDQDQ